MSITIEKINNLNTLLSATSISKKDFELLQKEYKQSIRQYDKVKDILTKVDSKYPLNDETKNILEQLVTADATLFNAELDDEQLKQESKMTSFFLNSDIKKKTIISKIDLPEAEIDFSKLDKGTLENFYNSLLELTYYASIGLNKPALDRAQLGNTILDEKMIDEISEIVNIEEVFLIANQRIGLVDTSLDKSTPITNDDTDQNNMLLRRREVSKMISENFTNTIEVDLSKEEVNIPELIKALTYSKFILLPTTKIGIDLNLFLNDAKQYFVKKVVADSGNKIGSRADFFNGIGLGTLEGQGAPQTKKVESKGVTKTEEVKEVEEDELNIESYMDF